MGIEDLFAGARVVSLEDFGTILRDVAKSVPDCGNDECPIHGKDGMLREEESRYITDLDGMTPEQMDENALTFVAAAHNALVDGNFNKALVYQKQTELWREAATNERIRLSKAQADEVPPATEAETRADAEEPVR